MSTLLSFSAIRPPSAELARQVFGLQVGVTAQHAQILVARDARDLHDIEAALKKAGGGLMAQIVETQVFESGSAHGADKGLFDRLGCESGKDCAV